MNRQEAIDFIHQTAQHLERLGEHNPAKALEIALETILPTPDPDTGLMPCGCGGKAETHELFGHYSGTYMTDCKECATGTTQYNTGKESQDAWNTAMGWKGGAE